MKILKEVAGVLALISVLLWLTLPFAVVYNIVADAYNWYVFTAVYTVIFAYPIIFLSVIVNE